MKIFYTAILALATSFLLMPLVIRLAERLNLVDKPGERKVHTTNIPRIGGVAVVAAFILPVLLFAPMSPVMKGILSGAIIVAIVGLLDDILQLNAYAKFAGQAVAAGIGMAMSGLVINEIDVFGIFKLDLGYFAYPFTLVWIVGITNAINLMDGLDGLAAGIVAIALFFLGLIGFLTNQYLILFISATLFGALLGFLKYNSHPAQVFMGDVGSLFLGFLVAMLTLIGSVRSAAVMTLALPLTILALPILDTAWAFTRRILKGTNPFSPDKKHIHHRLMNMGLGHGLTVMFMYGVATLLGILGVFSVYQYEFRDISLFIVAAGMVAAALKLITFIRRRPTLKHLFTKKVKPVPAGIMWLLRVTLLLPLIIRNLIIVALLLNVVLLVYTPVEGIIIGIILFAGILYLYLTHQTDTYEQFLLFFLFLAGVFIIFSSEQMIDPVILFGNFSAEVFSNVLFSVIGVLIILNILVKQISGNFLSNPLEYFILLIVVCLNLLPPDLTMEYHLAAVSIKSIILFLGYRLLLEYHMQRSRRLIYVTLLVIAFTVGYSLVKLYA